MTFGGDTDIQSMTGNGNLHENSKNTRPPSKKSQNQVIEDIN